MKAGTKNNCTTGGKMPSNSTWVSAMLFMNANLQTTWESGWNIKRSSVNNVLKIKEYHNKHGWLSWLLPRILNSRSLGNAAKGYSPFSVSMTGSCSCSRHPCDQYVESRLGIIPLGEMLQLWHSSQEKHEIKGDALKTSLCKPENSFWKS
jgi:hypothetical protein